MTGPGGGGEGGVERKMMEVVGTEGGRWGAWEEVVTEAEKEEEMGVERVEVATEAEAKVRRRRRGRGPGLPGGGEGGGGEGALKISRVMSTTSTVQRGKPSPCAFSIDSLTSLIGSRMMHSGE